MAAAVAVGEIGDVRREIVYLGDAVNVAKRLETEAGARRARLLISGDVVAGLRDVALARAACRSRRNSDRRPRGAVAHLRRRNLIIPRV